MRIEILDSGGPDAGHGEVNNALDNILHDFPRQFEETTSLRRPDRSVASGWEA
jgi:hypothetical protein